MNLQRTCMVAMVGAFAFGPSYLRALDPSADTPLVLTGESATPAAAAVIRFSDLVDRERAMVTSTAAPVPVRVRRTVPELEGPAARTMAPLQAAEMASRQTPSPAPTASFQAIADNSTYIPPDTMGAVGPSHVMTTLNTQTRVQSRSGATLSTVLTNTFWASVLPVGTTGTFDPRLQYDPFANRWIYAIACDGDNGNSSICIGASQTSDPMGTWYLFRIDADSTNTLIADYPMLGFNKDLVVVSANMYSLTTGVFQRGQIYAFNKANLYANSTAGLVTFASASVPSGMHPATTYDNNSSTLFLIRNYSSASGIIRKSALIGSPPALSVDSAIIASPLGPWSIPPGNSLPQLGTTALVDGADARMQSVFTRSVNGVTSIWCAQNIALPAGGSSRAAVQWWQLDGSSATSTTVLQQGRIDDASATASNGGKHFAYPNLAVNQYGDVLIGYSRFQSTAYPAAAYSLRMAADAAGTMRDDTTLKAGDGPYDKDYGYGENRWGDYSHTVVDPVNDRDFWTVQQYAAAAVGSGANSGRWSTWWGYVTLGTAPSFTMQPANQTVVVGANAAFTVVADGSPAPTLQWQRQPAGTTGFANVSNGGSYSGATSATLTIGNATTSMNGDQFRCVATNGVLPDATSSAVTLTVNPAQTTITPATRTAPAEGETYSITVASNTSWGAASNQTWATVSPPTGSGNGTVAVTVAAAASASSRTATITIGGQTHALTQNGATPIAITTPPMSQLTVAAGQVTFTIAATGSGPLVYQWYLTPAGSSTPQALNDLAGKLSGARSATLTVSNVQSADAGDYVCVVTNVLGSVTSSAAQLAVFDRLVKLSGQTAPPGSTIVLPVQLVAHGEENAVGFSVNFDATKLTFVSAIPGAQAADATLNVNSSQVGAGKLGLALAKPSGAVWSAATQEIVKITFTIGAAVPENTVVPLTFGDQPVVREISSSGAAALPAGYAGASLTVLSGYEADMNGNGVVTITDWVKVGRIVAGLDPAPTGIDFLKADCAPRSTFGNGALSITDWVQAGRYAAGLDPLTPVGGPAGP